MKQLSSIIVLFIAMVALLHAENTPKQVNAVHFSKIIPLLAAAPSGWTAQEPEGNTMEADGFKMTTVSQSYSKGEGDDTPTVSLNVIDYANNQAFYTSTTAMWNVSQESTTGYMKSVKIGEYPGFETYDKASKSGHLWVVVAQRFLVQVETTNLNPSELQVWLKLVDLKKLSELK